MVLKEIPTSATKSTFEGMVSTVLAINQISFMDDELLPEGKNHTLPTHIIVKCEDMIDARVLIDNGSALNFCLMSTFERLNMDTSLIRLTTMISSAFDGTLREVQGEIELAIGVGPMCFAVNFQVIKVDSPLHAAGVVASTLHQRLKFPFEDLMVTIMAEEPLTFFKETSVPYIGVNAFSEATFHSFELVSMISRAPNLELAWPSTTLMTAKEMLKFGYQLGQGLGAVGHGKASLVELPDNKGGFSLGYEPFDEEIFQASRGKKRKCIGQGMSIPHIRVTFLAPVEVIRSEVAQESCEEESDRACLIHLYPEEFSMNAIISPKDDLTATIRLYVLGETVGHWTTKPCFMVAPAE